MKPEIPRVSQAGFFSDPPQVPEKLVFRWQVALDLYHVVFSFSGSKEEVKKRVREVTGEVLHEAKYKINDSYKQALGIQIDIFIEQRAHTELTNMFWYIGKITGDFYDETQLLKDFFQKKIPVKHQDNVETSPLCLYRATKAAIEKSGQPLLLKGTKTEDKILWTEAELKEWQDEVALAKAKINNKKCIIS